MPIVTIPELTGIAYRAVSLTYYANGLSPKGARENAGRFNRIGLSALYIGLQPQTAIAEFYGSEEHTPLVLLPVKYDLRNVVDLTGDMKGWPKDWKKWDGNWRKALSAKGVPDCPSWRCGDDVVSRKMSGILYPSQYHPGHNALALFPENATLGSCKTEVQDPFGTILKANPAIL